MDASAVTLGGTQRPFLEMRNEAFAAGRCAAGRASVFTSVCRRREECFGTCSGDEEGLGDGERG